jgi:hypothetical protein
VARRLIAVDGSSDRFIGLLFFCCLIKIENNPITLENNVIVRQAFSGGGGGLLFIIDRDAELSTEGDRLSGDRRLFRRRYIIIDNWIYLLIAVKWITFRFTSIAIYVGA